MAALTIIILSITERTNLLDRIFGILKPQLTNDVELLLSITVKGYETIGSKRQRLKQAASGDFLCFIDDDDIVSEDYVSQIITQIKQNSFIDCVGFRGTIESPNGKICNVSYSLRNRDRIGRQNDEFFCGMGHLTPIKSEIAKSISFSEKNSGEDADFCREVMQKLRSEAFIDRILYRYLASYNV